MDDTNGSNFGNADGGGTVDGGDSDRDLGRAASNGEPGSPRNPAEFKRGRGRPRKDGSSAGSDSPGASSAGQSTAKSTGKGGAKLDVDLFAKQLVGWHAMLALATKNPIWIISEGEAKSLASALKDVMMMHSINIDPRTLAYVKLLGVIAMLYGPKFFYLAQEAKQRRDANPPEKDITPMAM